MQIANGMSNAAQMLQQMQQAYQNADANGDNALSEEEFATFDASMKANMPEGMDAANMPSAEDMFSQLDADGDGAVTLEEVANNAPPPPPPPPLSDETLQALLEEMEEAFAAADADGDGALSEAEFEAFDETMRANAPDGGPLASASEMFSEMDANGDGSVTLEEAQNAAPPPPPPPPAETSSSDEDDEDTLLAALYAQYETSSDLLSTLLDIEA